MKVLDHIGIAVGSLERRLAFYRALGLEAGAVEEVPSEELRVAFLPVKGTNLELLEPTGPGSPVAAFIAKRGEGLHHICFRVADIHAAMAELKAKGFELLADEPRPGAHGCLVCFVHPRSAGGVLVELSQPGG